MTPLRLVEVGPRDGLQNEPGLVPLDRKVRFVDALSESGVHEIEVGSFVSPKWVPQMADTDLLFARIARRPGVIYSALVPNETGLEKALAAKVDKIAVFTAASETFNRRNINASIAESINRFRPVIKVAHEAGLPVRGYISMAFHCPYEGRISPEAVLAVVRQLIELGIDDICPADTVGRATVDEVRQLLQALQPECPVEKLSLHFHDTFGHAVKNAIAAWKEFGVQMFDGAAGGLGGCPYAEGAPGNVATEALVDAFEGAGAKTGIDVARVREAALLVRASDGKSDR